MAQAPGHKFGQLIGETLEYALHSLLQNIATEHNLYLDYKHSRPARDDKCKVAWTDLRGNVHDLDYVLEDGGSEFVVGKPRAFIECAWRRYTKHSRNKAQEIQGAVVPLSEKYSDSHPFLGVVLAGVFTEGSLLQLQSLGFRVLYFPYDVMISAVKKVGIDIAYDENTADADILLRIKAFEKLSTSQKKKIARNLINIHSDDVEDFLSSLRTTLNRSIRSVYIVPLHGAGHELKSVRTAVNFLKKYKEKKQSYDFIRYELFVRYTNGDEVRGNFRGKAAAIDFLTALT